MLRHRVKATLTVDVIDDATGERVEGYALTRELSGTGPDQPIDQTIGVVTGHLIDDSTRMAVSVQINEQRTPRET